jgi:8-oxo-dGTP pyrophosphatase MutT (NUDIX family)
MQKKKVSIILFYDKEGNILLQDRRDISKHGEEYGFFGGHREGTENPIETLRREILEELGIDINNLECFKFFKNFKFKVPEFDLDLDIDSFTAKIPKIKYLQVKEGKIAIMKFKDSFNLKMVPGDSDILKEIYEYLKQNHIL